MDRNENNQMPEITIFGVDQETYKRYAEIAKRQGKPVVEVISAALRKGLETESVEPEKRLLMEG